MRAVTIPVVGGCFLLLIWANLRWAYAHPYAYGHPYESYGWPIPLSLLFVYHGMRPHPGEDHFWLVGVLLNTIIGFALLFCVAWVCEVVLPWCVTQVKRIKTH